MYEICVDTGDTFEVLETGSLAAVMARRADEVESASRLGWVAVERETQEDGFDQTHFETLDGDTVILTVALKED